MRRTSAAVKRALRGEVSRAMLSADVALANLINRTATAYVRTAPAFIVYRERTHITASIGRSQDINRFVKVRQADDYAVMQDLPQGAERTGQAFPIIPYFNPFAAYEFSWFANLKSVQITLQRGPSGILPIPQSDASADMTVAYFSAWAPAYAADSTSARADIIVGPTPALPANSYYPSRVIENGQTHLPQRIEIRSNSSDDVIALDYGVVQNHWVITHGTLTTRQHVGPMSFQVVSDTTYDQFEFPAAAPDPRLAGPPSIPG
jgi:hypothetical protein